MLNIVAAEVKPPQSRAPAEKAFHYRHVVSFEDTNVVGNVYFVRHLAWQGRCREMFIQENAPSVLDEIAKDLRLVTLRVLCNYHAEIFAFDQIDLEMWLVERNSNRIRLGFHYWRVEGVSRTLVADGFQEIASMRLTELGLMPCDMPRDLDDALHRYQTAPGEFHAS